MDITTNSKNATKNVSKPLAKIAILLVISLGLFWFSEDFSPARLFEPQSTAWVLVPCWLSPFLPFWSLVSFYIIEFQPLLTTLAHSTQWIPSYMRLVFPWQWSWSDTSLQKC